MANTHTHVNKSTDSIFLFHGVIPERGQTLSWRGLLLRPGSVDGNAEGLMASWASEKGACAISQVILRAEQNGQWYAELHANGKCAASYRSMPFDALERCLREYVESVTDTHAALLQWLASC